MPAQLFRMWSDDQLWTLGRLVAALGDSGKSAVWEVVDRPDNEFAGANPEILYGWAKNNRKVSVDRVISATSGTQVIDGEVRGYLTSTLQPWIVLRAGDSSYWEIETDDLAALELLSSSLTRVNER